MTLGAHGMSILTEDLGLSAEEAQAILEKQGQEKVGDR